MLYIFDIDGTLIDRESGEFLPGVERFFTNLPDYSRFALATNQGGPACHDAGWPWSEQYPSLADVEARYGALAARLGAKLFMSLIYQTSRGSILAPVGLSDQDPRLNPDWRKPKPGMLLAAMAHFGAKPQATLFVGDSEEDRQAAEAAGVSFISAEEFFAFRVVYSSDGSAVKIYGDFSTDPVICHVNVVAMFGGIPETFHGVKALLKANMLPRAGSESRPLKTFDIQCGRDNVERGERYWQYRSFTGHKARSSTGYDTVRGHGFREGNNFVIVNHDGQREFVIKGAYDDES